MVLQGKVCKYEAKVMRLAGNCTRTSFTNWKSLVVFNSHNITFLFQTEYLETIIKIKQIISQYERVGFCYDCEACSRVP